MKKITVLYIAIDSSMGGSTASLYNLIDATKDYVNPLVLFREGGVGVEFFKQHGVECYVYPFVSLINTKENRLTDVWHHPWRWHYIKKWRNEYSCVKFVKAMLNGRKVSIVHSNTSANDIGIALSKSLRAKHMWHVREFGDLDFHFHYYLGRNRISSVINRADARIAISTAIKEHWHMKDMNTYVINDAIRNASDICYIHPKQRYLLFTSYYITESKGAGKAIESFAKSKVANNGYTLKMVGDCDEVYKKILKEQARSFDVEHSIEFIPCQKDVKPYFAHATAYIMASEFEGLGRVTGEAMFYGCPVIAHATGGTLDLVRDGETGYLFNTIDECAQLIRKVCFENQEPLILRAQKYAVDNLSQEVYGPKILEVYNKILSY